MHPSAPWLPLFLIAGLTACAGAPDRQETSPPLPLTGTEWTAQTIAGEAVTGRAPSISFAAENRSFGYAGCNQFFAQYHIQGPELRISHIGSTRKACEPERNALEQSYLRGLETVRSYERSAAELRLLDETGTPVVIYSPTAPAGQP